MAVGIFGMNCDLGLLGGGGTHHFLAVNLSFTNPIDHKNSRKYHLVVNYQKSEFYPDNKRVEAFSLNGRIIGFYRDSKLETKVSH